MEDVCEDYLSELRAASGSASERRVIVLCDRLFVQYYTGIQNRLVLEVRILASTCTSLQPVGTHRLPTCSEVVSFVHTPHQLLP